MSTSAGREPATAHSLADPDTGWTVRFGWWWRSVFVEKLPPVSMAETLAPLFEPALRVLAQGESPGSKNSSETSKGGPANLSLATRLFGVLNASRERSAFFYELAKRLIGHYEFNKPWIRLNESQRALLEKRWPTSGERIVCRFLKPGEPPPEGFCRLAVVWWNLRVNDQAILTELRRMIGAKRSALGIPNPPPNRGRSLKPLSWRPIELMDLRNAEVRLLNESERSSVSKAIKLYRASI